MTWLNADFTVDDAISRGHTAWDLLINNWGNESAPSADGTSLQFPSILTRALPAPAAIAIGPRSLVDHAIVRWDVQKVLPQNSTWDFYRRLSVDAPLSFWQPANRQLAGVGSNGGSIVLLTQSNITKPPSNAGGNLGDDSLRFGTQYYKADGTLATFAANTASAGAAPKFISPLLHLIYYLQPPIQIPTKRAPFFYQYTFRVDGSLGTEVLCAQIPIFGRRRLRISCRPEADVLTFRAGVLDQLASTAIIPQEQTIWTAAAVPIGVPAVADVELTNAAYLMIYMTGADADIQAGITVTAID